MQFRLFFIYGSDIYITKQMYMIQLSFFIPDLSCSQA